MSIIVCSLKNLWGGQGIQYGMPTMIKEFILQMKESKGKGCWAKQLWKWDESVSIKAKYTTRGIVF